MNNKENKKERQHIFPLRDNIKETTNKRKQEKGTKDNTNRDKTDKQTTWQK